MVRWTSHFQRLRETLLDFQILNTAPLRVGGGREAKLGSPVDLPLLSLVYAGVDLPYIPGTSLKGAFRSCAESLALRKGLEGICTGLSRETCMDGTDAGGLPLRQQIEGLIRDGRSKEAMEFFWSRACLLCRIFGAPTYRGKVLFFDAYPIKAGSPYSPKRGIKTGIAIDRRRGEVYRGALYQVEYVEPGGNFHASIHCHDLPNYALGLLASVMMLLDSGFIKIGGFKTRGFGTVKIEELSFRHREYGRQALTLPPLDERDGEVDLSDLASLEEGWIVAEGEKAWKVLDRLKARWEDVEL